MIREDRESLSSLRRKYGTESIDLLRFCTQSDDLTEAEQAHLVWKILDGTCDIVGTYPGEDYGVEERPGEDGKR